MQRASEPFPPDEYLRGALPRGAILRCKETDADNRKYRDSPGGTFGPAVSYRFLVALRFPAVEDRLLPPAWTFFSMRSRQAVRNAPANKSYVASLS